MHSPRADTPAGEQAVAAVPGPLSEALDALCALADLAEPSALAAESVRVAAGLALVALGASDVAPSPQDRRVSDPAWSENWQEGGLMARLHSELDEPVTRVVVDRAHHRLEIVP